MLDVVIILSIIIAVIISSTLTSTIIKKKSTNRTNVLVKQFDMYKKQAEEMSEMRKFRHDYKNQLSGLQILLSAGEYEKASAYLAEINDNFISANDKVQTYSDNALIDAILRNVAHKCKEKNIDFSGCVMVLDKLNLTDLQVCTIFSNIADNAYEAALDISDNNDTKPFVSFTSSIREKWLIITAENSFDGILNTDTHKNILTRKKNDIKNHGIGLKSIQSIINSVDGAQMKIEPDIENKIFSIRLIFPVL